MWFYMSPQSPKPSMHEVVTGFYVANERDQSVGIRDDFGATTLIINGGLECGSLTPSTGASNRAAYYNDLLTYFGLPQESDTGCEDMGSFSNQSSSAYAQNFEAGTEYGKCALVSY